MTKTTRYAANTAAAGLAAIALGLAAPASAYTVSGTLEGDPRASSPQGILLEVTVVVGQDGVGGFDAQGCTAGTGSSCSHWTVDLQMDATHPTAFLSEFYFNLGDEGEESKFDGATFAFINPSDWTVKSPADELGSGNWDGDAPPGFMFEANGDASETRVTNANSLTFNMTLASDSFDVSGSAFNDFVGPDVRLSDTTAFEGLWQLGAKVQSLGENGGGSGFAGGGFDTADEPPPPPPGVPEPGTMALFGLGLVGLRLARRQRII